MIVLKKLNMTQHLHDETTYNTSNSGAYAIGKACAPIPCAPRS